MLSSRLAPPSLSSLPHLLALRRVVRDGAAVRLRSQSGTALHIAACSSLTVGRSSRTSQTKKVLDVERSWKRFTLSRSQESNSRRADLRAPVLRDIARVWLRDLRWNPMTSSRVARGRDLSTKLHVRDRRYEILNLAALSNEHHCVFQHAHRRTSSCSHCLCELGSLAYGA